MCGSVVLRECPWRPDDPGSVCQVKYISGPNKFDMGIAMDETIHCLQRGQCVIGLRL